MRPKYAPSQGNVKKKNKIKTIFPEKISLRAWISGKEEGSGIVEPCFRGAGRGPVVATTTRERVADGTDYVTISKRFSKNAWGSPRPGVALGGAGGWSATARETRVAGRRSDMPLGG